MKKINNYNIIYDIVIIIITIILAITNNEKTANLPRNLHGNGVIWCEKIAKMVSYALIHAYKPFFS